MDEPITEDAPAAAGDPVGSAGGAGDVDAARHLRRDAGDDIATPRRRGAALVVAAIVPAVLLVILVIAWAVDTSSGGVARNVSLAGSSIGGLSEDDLAPRVAAVAEEHTSTPVEIVTPDATYETTAGEIGLLVDQQATSQAALDIDRNTFVLLRPFAWAASLVNERTAPVRFTVGSDFLADELLELQGDDRVPPKEPAVEVTEEGFELVPGEAGLGLDPDQLAAELVSAAATAASAVQVEIEPSAIPPLGTDAAAQAAAAQAESLTAEPLEITTDGGAEEIPPEVLRTWITLDSQPDGSVDVAVDPDAVSQSLRGRFAGIEGAPVDARFTVEGGRPVIVPDQPGLVCCAESSATRIIDALEHGDGSVDLELTEGPAAFTAADAEELGIVEEVGNPDEFGPTTHHACCESRVQNIHRMADLVRGVVIRPGETFSVNQHVGRRTREKGFTDGGAIANGLFTSAVGGGVSQFATTLFNAALYAGLDFGEYQAHSIYISRYPRGHEATLSFPHPDLEIVNTTEYGVLLWPEYTDTSITVRIFSTRHIDVSVGEPSASSAGRCTRWTVPRTRTYADGRVERDSVFARYRPAEGVNC